jgi:hypothetical protein
MGIKHHRSGVPQRSLPVDMKDVHEHTLTQTQSSQGGESLIQRTLSQEGIGGPARRSGLLIRAKKCEKVMRFVDC